MKISLITKKIFALHLPLSAGFLQLGHEVQIFDPEKEISTILHRLNLYSNRLPFHTRTKIQNYFFNNINQKILDAFNSIEPDLVLVYNHGWLKPKP